MTTVVVQAGHYDRKTGSTGTNGEQAYNLDVARRTVAELRRRGATAKWIDADEPGPRYTGDYFVAVHADGSTSPQAEGSSVGYRDPRGKTLALAIKTHYQRRARKAGYALRFRADNYTTALGRYYGTGYAIDQNPSCRAVIVEGGFLTNPTERRFLNSAAGRAALALAIADAIIPAPAPPPKPPDPPQEDDEMVMQRYSDGGPRGEYVITPDGAAHLKNATHRDLLIAEGRATKTLKKITKRQLDELLEKE